MSGTTHTETASPVAETTGRRFTVRTVAGADDSGAGRRGRSDGPRRQGGGQWGGMRVAGGAAGGRQRTSGAGARWPGGRPCYFRAPAVSPAWTCRWKAAYTTSTGSMAIIMPAISAPQSFS